jgi:hypothetical protein
MSVAAAEHEQMPAVRIAFERLLHQQRQAVEASAHIGVAGRKPHPHAARNGDHRRRSLFAKAAIIADAIDGSTAPAIRIRAPLANSISTTLLAAGDNAGAGVEHGSDGAGAIVTAENLGALSGALGPERHSSCRHRNNWLE